MNNHYFLYFADREGFGGVPKSAKQRMLENRQRQLASLNRMEEKLNRMDQRYSKFVKGGGGGMGLNLKLNKTQRKPKIFIMKVSLLDIDKELLKILFFNFH